MESNSRRNRLPRVRTTTTITDRGLVAEEPHVAGDTGVGDELRTAANVHPDRHRAGKKIVDDALRETLSDERGFVNAGVTYADQRFMKALAVAVLHAAVVAEDVAELVGEPSGSR